jgi:NADH-quinone oxidoreductase subunit K
VSRYIILSSCLFIIGSFGTFLVKKHIIIILIAFELILLSITINFVVFSIYLDDLLGQLYALLVLTVAASESAIGLAILIVYYKLRGGISLDLISLLKA